MIRDVMQTAGLEGFAELGIILFVVAFAMIFINAFFGLKEEELKEMEELPLNQDTAGGDAAPEHA